MCGIAGYVGLSWSSNNGRDILQRMLDTLRHRGPDDEGLYVDAHVGLGNRRLSIIDLAGGHQPIADEKKNLQIVLNGEIYNHNDLRKALLNQGHRFISSSDTEVALHQFKEEGPQALLRFNGMFALAIWDRDQQTLFLARDRMGIKPLYYYWDGTHFLFASEIKALLTAPNLSRELNPLALWDYLSLRYVPGPQTMWRHIYQVPPAHTLTFSLRHKEPVLHRYWDIPYREGGEASNHSIADYRREFGVQFQEAVRRHMVADVPVGILLSGGIDSSAVAAAVRETQKGDVLSFSVGFESGLEDDELPHARQVAQALQLKHHEVRIGPKEFLDYLPDLVYDTDQPLADLASVPLFYVARLASNHVKVVLSGEGSDETLAGYDFDRYLRHEAWRRSWQQLPAALKSILKKLALLGGSAWQERAEAWDRPVSMTHLFNTSQKQSYYRDPPAFRDTMDLMRQTLKTISVCDPLHQALYLYCQSWLVDDLLAKADRMTMAHSLELRVPFLDHELVEWLARTPSWVKVDPHPPKGIPATKRLLRDYARGRLPESILTRPKKGFPVPAYDWLDGPLKSWAEGLLNSQETRSTRYFSPLSLQTLLRQATDSRATGLMRHRLWQFLILELWMRRWKV